MDIPEDNDSSLNRARAIARSARSGLLFYTRHMKTCIRRNQVAAFAAMSGHGAERVAGLK